MRRRRESSLKGGRETLVWHERKGIAAAAAAAALETGFIHSVVRSFIVLENESARGEKNKSVLRSFFCFGECLPACLQWQGEAR
jgi:hypothetical protein